MRNWDKERKAIWNRYLNWEIEWQETTKLLDKLEEERQEYYK